MDPSRNRQLKIDQLIWREVAHKGIPATLAFCFVAILVFIYHFETTVYKSWIQTGCVLVIASNIIRMFVSMRMLKTPEIDRSQWRWLRYSVWLNAVAWSIVFNLASIELNFTGPHFSTMVFILTGFLAASIVTLGYDKYLFFPFQILILLPVAGITYNYYLQTGESSHLTLSVFYSIFFLYQTKQYVEYRKQLIERFSYQLDLEDSYADLKISQQAFIEQTAKLMQTSKIAALGEMAGGLAHEVNNSLMVILGSSQQIERKLQRDQIQDSWLTERFDKARNAIMKIKTVIESLHFFSQQMESSPKCPTRLSEIIQRTMNYCHEMIKAHGITLDIESVPDLSIHANSFQVTQVLFNLVKNADDALNRVKELPERWIKIAFEVKKDFVEIRVSNGGPTIPQEIAGKLFQPFFTTKDVGKGTGLNLSISKGIAQDHHGDLHFESSSFSTTFVLRLPIVEEVPHQG